MSLNGDTRAVDHNPREGAVHDMEEGAPSSILPDRVHLCKLTCAALNLYPTTANFSFRSPTETRDQSNCFDQSFIVSESS